MDAINRAIFKRLSQLIVSRPEEEPPDHTWAFFDEAREAGKLDGLRQVLTTGRSKSAHVVLGFQDIEGFRDAYGEKQANEMLGQCGNLAILKLGNPAMAKWAAEYFGEYEYMKESAGQSVSDQGGQTASTNVTLAQRKAILEQEFMLFPPTTRDHGLTGVFATLSIPGWKGTVPPTTIEERLHRRPDIPGFIPRPIADQERQPWGEDDETRLRLKSPDVKPGLRTLSESPAVPEPARRPGRKELSPRHDPSWLVVGASKDYGALKLLPDGRFSLGGLNFSQEPETSVTLGAHSISKPEGPGGIVTIRGPEMFLEFRFAGGRWFRRWEPVRKSK
jgi:hypothetical protein